MKKLIMIAIVLVVAGQSWGLKYPDDSPPWRWCPGPYIIPNTGVVFWEFIDDGCMPTSDEYDPPYFYEPELGAPTFGSRHWDDPYDDSGWGGSYGQDLWTWSDGVFTIPEYAEDSFNQPIPERGEKQYLTQYLQVVHTMPDLPQGDLDDLGLIGLGLEIWDMSVYQENGWTGCPVGYENLPGDGYLNGYDFPSPDQHYELGDGWWKSIWVSKFSTDGSYYSGEYEESFPELYYATHTVCIVGMEIGSPWQIEEVVVDFVWHDSPEPPECPPPPCWSIVIDSNDIPIYEPQDAGGPPPAGPTEGQFLVRFAWQPGYPTYPPFTAKVVADPDPDQEILPRADFTFPASTEPNGNVTLIFNETNWNIPQNVHVAATADLLREGNESFSVDFTVTIDIADCNFGGPGCEPVRRRKGLTVVDNDIPYIIAEPDEIEVSENDPCTAECFNVRLSHLPDADVKVLLGKGGWAAEEGMFKITPPLEETSEPNCLTFTVNPGQAWDPCTMTSGFNVEQTICVNAVDNDELAQAWEEIIDGEIILTGQSEDEWYNDMGFGGELEAEEVDVEVQDNECGAWGYDHRDVNKDCYVNLGDFALLAREWLMCVQPYGGEGCDKLWNLLEEE